MSAFGGAPPWMCQTGFASRSFGACRSIGFEKLLILVGVTRDHIEIEPLGGFRLAIHEKREAFRAGVAEPLFDGEPVALRLGDFLALLVEKKLVVETFRRRAAERAADFAGKLHRVDQVLAGHLVVDAQRHPTHRPIRLPLQFAAPAGDERSHVLCRIGILVGDGSSFRIVRDHRHLQDGAGPRRDRQERRIGKRALRAQRRQHDRHHRLEVRKHFQERIVETSRRVASSRRQEFVVEAELIEECAQARVVVIGEARMRAERIGHLGQRLVEVLRHHFFVGDIVGNLAQAVHVVGKSDEPRLDRVGGEHAEGVAHHRGARHLAERADMRQAGRAVAGLEDDLVLRVPLQPRHDLARFLERPGVRLLGERAQIRWIFDRHGGHCYVVGPCRS